MRTYYDILGVSRIASDEEIHRAFRRRIRENHPDLVGDSQEATERTVAINSAYAVLSNPEKRREYDQSLSDGFDVGTVGRRSWASSSHAVGTAAPRKRRSASRRGDHERPQESFPYWNPSSSVSSEKSGEGKEKDFGRGYGISHNGGYGGGGFDVGFDDGFDGGDDDDELTRLIRATVARESIRKETLLMARKLVRDIPREERERIYRQAHEDDAAEVNGLRRKFRGTAGKCVTIDVALSAFFLLLGCAETMEMRHSVGYSAIATFVFGVIASTYFIVSLVLPEGANFGNHVVELAREYWEAHPKGEPEMANGSDRLENYARRAGSVSDEDLLPGEDGDSFGSSRKVRTGSYGRYARTSWDDD